MHCVITGSPDWLQCLQIDTSSRVDSVLSAAVVGVLSGVGACLYWLACLTYHASGSEQIAASLLLLVCHWLVSCAVLICNLLITCDIAPFCPPVFVPCFTILWPPVVPCGPHIGLEV